MCSAGRVEYLAKQPMSKHFSQNADISHSGGKEQMEGGILHQLCEASTEGYYEELVLKPPPAPLGRHCAHFFICHVVIMVLSLSPFVMTSGTGTHRDCGFLPGDVQKPPGHDPRHTVWPSWSRMGPGGPKGLF